MVADTLCQTSARAADGSQVTLQACCREQANSSPENRMKPHIHLIFEMPRWLATFPAAAPAAQSRRQLLALNRARTCHQPGQNHPARRTHPVQLALSPRPAARECQRRRQRTQTPPGATQAADHPALVKLRQIEPGHVQPRHVQPAGIGGPKPSQIWLGLPSGLALAPRPDALRPCPSSSPWPSARRADRRPYQASLVCRPCRPSSGSSSSGPLGTGRPAC